MENLKAICDLCKLSLWEWNIPKDNFKLSGYFGSSQHSLNSFLMMVNSSDRNNLEKLMLQSPVSFEKIIRLTINKDQSEWVYLRGQIQPDADHIIHGILLVITNDKQIEDTNHDSSSPAKLTQSTFKNEIISKLIHELTQPLMVIHTYVNGCIYRLQEDKLDNAQLLEILSSVKQHAGILGRTIHQLNDILSQYYEFKELAI